MKEFKFLNVKLTNEHKKMVDYLAVSKGLGLSALIRNLIIKEYKSEVTDNMKFQKSITVEN